LDDVDFIDNKQSPWFGTDGLFFRKKGKKKVKFVGEVDDDQAI